MVGWSYDIWLEIILMLYYEMWLYVFMWTCKWFLYLFYDVLLKENMFYKSTLIMILRIMQFLVQVFVLIPYILSISKGVGGIWEESRSWSFDKCSFKQRVGIVLTIFEDILIFIFPYWMYCNKQSYFPMCWSVSHVPIYSKRGGDIET